MKNRNPIAKAVRKLSPKVVPDKREKLATLEDWNELMLKTTLSDFDETLDERD